jgi:hypothetical protein
MHGKITMVKSPPRRLAPSLGKTSRRKSSASGVMTRPLSSMPSTSHQDVHLQNLSGKQNKKT